AQSVSSHQQSVAFEFCINARHGIRVDDQPPGKFTHRRKPGIRLQTPTGNRRSNLFAELPINRCLAGNIHSEIHDASPFYTNSNNTVSSVSCQLDFLEK